MVTLSTFQRKDILFLIIYSSLQCYFIQCLAYYNFFNFPQRCRKNETQDEKSKYTLETKLHRWPDILIFRREFRMTIIIIQKLHMKGICVSHLLSREADQDNTHTYIHTHTLRHMYGN